MGPARPKAPAGPNVAADGRLEGSGTGSGASTGGNGDGRRVGEARGMPRRGGRMAKPPDGEAAVCGLGERMDAGLDARSLDDTPPAAEGEAPSHAVGGLRCLRRGSRSSVGDGVAVADGRGPGVPCTS